MIDLTQDEFQDYVNKDWRVCKKCSVIHSNCINCASNSTGGYCTECNSSGIDTFLAIDKSTCLRNFNKIFLFI